MTTWKKTFYSAWIAQIFSIMGFSFIIPFLPYYVGELGVEGQAAQSIWSGIVISATPVTLIIFSPFWGILADKYGRKPMLLRSMFGGAIVLALMAFVQNVGQLLVCRLLQGALTGTIAASVALVASVTPQRRTGYTLGMMQSAVFIGFAFGPGLSGPLADKFGIRIACIVGGCMLLVGGLLVNFGTREDFTAPDRSSEGSRRSFAGILATTGFLVAACVLASIRFSNSMTTPAFPLIVRELHGAAKNLYSVTGYIILCTGLAAAASAYVLGRLSDAWGHKRVLIIFSAATAVVMVAHVFARNIPHLFVARTLFGVTVAGMAPAANAIIRRVTPDHEIGRAYGLATSLSSVGMALGPLTGGFIAAGYGLRAPFIVAGIGLILVTLLAAACIRSSMAETTGER